MSSNILEFNLEALFGPMNHHDLVVAGRIVMADTADEDLKPAGAIICCGNPDYYKSVAEEGFRLYKMGLSSTIVVSGGNRIKIEKVESIITEAVAMKKILIEKGVPEEDILVEPNAAHSAENAIFSRELLESSTSQGWSLRSVIGVGVRLSSNRFRDTFKKSLPEVDIMFKGAEDIPDITPDNWMKNDDAALYIVREIIKDKLYRLRGHAAHHTSDEIIPGVNCADAMKEHTDNVTVWKKDKNNSPIND